MRPLLALAYVGSHKKSGCADIAKCCILCSAILFLLDLILEETRGNIAYRFLFVKCSFQDIYRALRIIRVYVPSSYLCCETFSVHDSDPYIQVQFIELQHSVFF